MLNQEGGIEPEQFRVEAMIDWMDTLGKSLLGWTVNGCQCHNHKYDPFSQKEYYQLYAFLKQRRRGISRSAHGRGTEEAGGNRGQSPRVEIEGDA